jgi:hypothetical protein
MQYVRRGEPAEIFKGSTREKRASLKRPRLNIKGIAHNGRCIYRVYTILSRPHADRAAQRGAAATVRAAVIRVVVFDASPRGWQEAEPFGWDPPRRKQPSRR